MREEYISRDHFRGGNHFAFVRDVHGIRVGLRNIPRDHRILIAGAVTTHPATGDVVAVVGGEGFAYLGDVEEVIAAWNNMLGTMLEPRGVGFRWEVQNFSRNGEPCPFHGETHNGR